MISSSCARRGMGPRAAILWQATKFEKEITGFLLIDTCNDFISEGGKLWDRIKSVAEANDCIPHMLQLLTTARKTGLRVFYAMHHRYQPGRLRNLVVRCASGAPPSNGSR